MLSSTFWIRPSPPWNIKSVFEQLNRREEAKEKLEKLNLERQKLIDEVNAPLKRKANIVQAEMPNPKRARNEPSEKKIKAKIAEAKIGEGKTCTEI